MIDLLRGPPHDMRTDHDDHETLPRLHFFEDGLDLERHLEHKTWFIVYMVLHWPKRYFAGLSRALKLTREKELLKRRTSKTFRLGKSDTYAKTRKSHWTLQFHKVYPGLKFNKNVISKKTGIPVKTLDTVYNRGRRAWQTGGSRPGTTANQWGAARLYKFVLVSKKKAPRSWYATRADPDQDLRNTGLSRRRS